MLLRLFMLIMVFVQILCFVPGCEQIKDYRKKVYYEKGVKLYEAQQYTEALAQLGYALEFDANYLDALALSGLCHYDLENYEAAGAVFEKAVLLDGSRYDLSLQAAQAYTRLGKYGRVINCARILLEHDPGNPQARLLDARARLRSRWLGYWAKVESLLLALLDEEECRDQAFALLAEFHILNDNLEKAELILTEHANANEDWFFVMRMLAEKYVVLKDQQAAVRVYRKVLELQPDSTQDIQQLRTIMRRTGSSEDERQLLVSLIPADGQQIRYKLALVDFYLHYGQYSEAEETIRAGLEEGSGYFDFSRYLIDVYEKTNRYKDAIQVAKDVLSQLDKEEAFALRIEFMNILARLYYGSNNREMAQGVIRWVLDLDSDNLSARFLLARILLDEERTLLAISELRGLGAEDTENSDYDYYIGLAHMARGEDINAEQSFKEALRKNPLNKQALLKISELYLEKGYFGDVALMINEFLTINPNDPDVLALQAEVASNMIAVPDGD